jgi:hypothetical protein
MPKIIGSKDQRIKGSKDQRIKEAKRQRVKKLLGVFTPNNKKIT